MKANCSANRYALGFPSTSGPNALSKTWHPSSQLSPSLPPTGQRCMQESAAYLSRETSCPIWFRQCSINPGSGRRQATKPILSTALLECAAVRLVFPVPKSYQACCTMLHGPSGDPNPSAQFADKFGDTSATGWRDSNCHIIFNKWTCSQTQRTIGTKCTSE